MWVGLWVCTRVLIHTKGRLSYVFAGHMVLGVAGAYPINPLPLLLMFGLVQSLILRCTHRVLGQHWLTVSVSSLLLLLLGPVLVLIPGISGNIGQTL